MTTKRQPDDASDLLCPECRVRLSGLSSQCSGCGANLTWLMFVRKFREILFQRAAGLGTPSKEAPLEIVAPPSDDEIPLPAEFPEIEIGRSILQSSSRIVVADPHVDEQHALIVHQRRPEISGTWAEDDWYWIADRGTSGGTFVNGKAIDVQRLQCGDLIQIGPRAWLFSHLSPTGENAVPRRACLIPVAGIEGLSLELRDVSVRNLLRNIHLTVSPGQFVAIVGESGGGKSTLLRAILGVRNAVSSGEVRADGRNAKEEPGWFRSQIGYMSQTDAIPGDLTAFEAVQFTALLRGSPSGEPDVKRTLRQVDLPERSWNTLCRNLSGGESKRVRAAAEIISQPRLFILDEPGSGLDDQRETIMMRLLRGLTHRGCTVLIVTHNPEQLRHVDRVLKVNKGEIVSDQLVKYESTERSPAATSAKRVTTSATQVDPECPTTGTIKGRPAGEDSTVAKSACNGLAEAWRQFQTLCRREFALLRNAWVRRGLLPVVVVPLLFAVAAAVSVPAKKHSLLGFLAILSCIWMGASLSVMSIVDEREAYDHERLLFLKPVPYVFSKAFVLGILTLLQTVLFVVTLAWLCHCIWGGDAMLYGVGWVGAVLVLVAFAAVGMGLVISSLAGTHRPTANFLLPLAMMFQILFSIQVAGKGDGPIYKSYGEFNGHPCSYSPCVRRAQVWRPDLGGWLCERCQGYCLENPKRNPPEESLVEAKAAQGDLPDRWAAWASLLTLSRWGDMALRSFAYTNNDFKQFCPQTAVDTGRAKSPPSEAHQLYAYHKWRQVAAEVLISLALLLPLGTVLILHLSESTLWTRIHHR